MGCLLSRTARPLSVVSATSTQHRSPLWVGQVPGPLCMGVDRDSHACLMQAPQKAPHRFEGRVRHRPVRERRQSHVAGDEGQLLTAIRGETDRSRGRVEAVLLQRKEIGMQGARVARRWALHQRTPAEDRPRVRHPTDQRLTFGRHEDHASADQPGKHGKGPASRRPLSVCAPVDHLTGRPCHTALTPPYSSRSAHLRPRACPRSRSLPNRPPGWSRCARRSPRSRSSPSACTSRSRCW